MYPQAAQNHSSAWGTKHQWIHPYAAQHSEQSSLGHGPENRAPGARAREDLFACSTRRGSRAACRKRGKNNHGTLQYFSSFLAVVTAVLVLVPATFYGSGTAQQVHQVVSVAIRGPRCSVSFG